MADYESTHPISLTPVAESPIQIRHLYQSPRIDRPKKIHRRHILPRIREGAEREFHSTTAPLALTMPRAIGGEITLVRNDELLSPGQQSTASTVGEPSVAMNGDVVFYTGNWYAAVSTNGGQNFSFINPAEEFPTANPPGSNFCCDQVVHYIKAIDTFVWLLQYGPEAGDNIQRIGFAKTADVAAGRWRLFDLTTQAINSPGAFMDFPDLAVGANNLYVTTNIFGRGDSVGAAVVRIPFAGIESGDVRARPFVSMDFQSFRVAQNCTTSAYFAAHRDTSTLEVFCWEEAKDDPVPKAIGVARWIGGNSGYQSRTPDGNRWLDRADPRITGAAMAGNELWFAWGVDKNSNQRPRPFVQMARIDATNLTLLENVNIFDTDSATCYAGLATNADGEVGVSYMIGGGSRFPTHVVGILTNDRKNVTTSAGARSPQDSQWGDYLTVRRAYPNERLFAATGFSLLGAGNGSNRDVTPRYVVFGRASAVGAVAPTGGGTTTTGGTTTGTGTGTGTTAPPATGVFTDVNTLPVVSAVVAAKVLEAAQLAGASPHASEEIPLRFVNPELVTKPGVERWPVKTGRDSDIALVGKNVIDGVDLGAGIVPATIAELIRIGRPSDMQPVNKVFSAYQNKRRGPVEWIVWQIEGQITVVKLEADGDYHLVVQGPSGDTMIAEVPTPTKTFIGDSPWLENIKAARAAVDQHILAHLAAQDFVPFAGLLVPIESVSEQQRGAPMQFPRALTPAEGQESTIPLFQTRVNPTPARITGVGFFDAVHGQTGVAQLNGIELHPVLKIEWL